MASAAQPDVGGAAAESGGASGERLTALEGRVQALEGALGGEGGAGGFGGADVAEMQNELNSIKEKIKGFESITEQFSADHIIEALKDLDELREKLLAKPGIYCWFSYAMMNAFSVHCKDYYVFKKSCYEALI